MSTGTIVFWRAVFLCAGFLVLTFAVHRQATVRTFSKLRIPGVVLALLSCITNSTFVVAITHTAVARTLLIVAAAPVFTAVLSRVLLAERLPLRTWLTAVIVFVGVLVILRGSLGSGETVGELAAVACSISASLIFVVLRRFRDIEPLPALATGAFIAAILSTPFVSQFAPSSRDIVYLALNGGIVLPVAWALVSIGPRLNGATQVSLLLLLETVLGPLWVWAVQGETPSPQTWLAGVLIVTALAVHSIQEVMTERGVSRHDGTSFQLDGDEPASRDSAGHDKT